MNRLTYALLAALALWSTPSPAQQPITLPPGTVYGRLGVTAGPGQAIPFATLYSNLLSAQTANTVLAGPTSGGVATPTFRPLVAADIPGTVVRERLLADRTYYVRTDGSDANCSGQVNAADPGSGTVPRACAFLTIQKSVNNTCSALDVNGFTVFTQLQVTITFTENVSFCNYTGDATSTQTNPTILGDPANAANYVVTAKTVASGGTGTAFVGVNARPWTINGLTVNAADTSCIEADIGATIYIKTIRFGSCNVGVQSIYQAKIEFLADYSIVAGSNTQQLAAAGGQILAQPGHTVTISGTPALGTFASCASGGAFLTKGTTYSGTTGVTVRWNFDPTCLVDTGGTAFDTFFPGTVNGGYGSGFNVGQGGTGFQTAATNAIILGGGGSAALQKSGCLIDSANSLTCASATAFSPAPSLTNSTNDANPAIFFWNKNRAGGNTNSGDIIGRFIGRGFANTAQQNTSELRFNQTGASSGSNIPSSVQFLTSNTVGLLNQSVTFDDKAHLGIVASAAATSASACGTTPGTPAGSDLSGTVVTGTAGPTACTINFAANFSAAPKCTCGLSSGAGCGQSAGAVGSATFTFGAAATSATLTWHCLGN